MTILKNNTFEIEILLPLIFLKDSRITWILLNFLVK